MLGQAEDNVGGEVRGTLGFRAEFNSRFGPCCCGLAVSPFGLPRFSSSSIEQIFAGALTGMPIERQGGGKSTPGGGWDGEVMRLWLSFMTELFRHLGAPPHGGAGEIGVGAREEIGYLFAGIFAGRKPRVGGPDARSPLGRIGGGEDGHGRWRAMGGRRCSRFAAPRYAGNFWVRVGVGQRGDLHDRKDPDGWAARSSPARTRG